MTKKKTPAAALQPLPKGIRASDIKYTAGKKYVDLGERWHFDIYYVPAFGWVLPTLLIKQAARHSRADEVSRTYAVTLDGKIVRVGLGPHVTQRHTVYVALSRRKDLQRYLDLIEQGKAAANEVRDNISTRRANTALRRARTSF